MAPVAGIELPDGDPGAVAGAAAALDRVGADLARAEGAFRRALASVPDWRGVASTCYAGLGATCATGARRAEDACSRAAAAVRAYGRKLEESQTRVRRLQLQAEDCLRRIDAANRRAADASSRAGAAELRSLAGSLGAAADGGAAVAAAQREAGAARAEQDQARAAAAAAEAELQQLRRQAQEEQQAAQAAGRIAAGQVHAACSAIAGAAATLDRRGHTGLGFVRDNGRLLGTALAVLGPGGVVPVLLATANGYRLVVNDRYATVRGRRFLDDDFFSRYIRTGRPRGTRYAIDNPEVAKLFRYGPAFEARARGLLPLDRGFLRAAGKGGGPVALGLTLGGDVYDFTLGPQAGKGVASTDFAATAAVDTTILGGTAAVGTGAGVMAVAGVGAMTGSVVPGLGTAVGFGVALVVGGLLMTRQGRAMRGAMISGTKSAIEFTGEHPLVLEPVLPGAAAALELYDHRQDIVGLGSAGLHGVGEGVHDAGSGLKAGVRTVDGGSRWVTSHLPHFP